MTEYLQCHLCTKEWEVSEEDPDSTLSDGIEHLSVHSKNGVTVNPAFALSLSKEPRRIGRISPALSNRPIG